ncbi:predicted protein [Lichtheimia corymbifera JMRC:FSU:9682]|uniref:Uncharacterized protein n=1 Tax=Lichtheimia corymbifera JMRC:FSU:9682 TaxID=1263082 RepID=A0A068RL00_9FUNG|nr:predicted protein [Lichtheimia corymbifera JMRC:FSU:9682]
MIKKINQKATGIKVELTNNNKFLKVTGSQQKVDRAFTFLQQLVATETSAATVYVVIGVAGVNMETKLDTLQQELGNAGKTTPADNLHFSIGHMDATSSASETVALAGELDATMSQAKLPTEIKS